MGSQHAIETAETRGDISTDREDTETFFRLRGYSYAREMGLACAPRLLVVCILSLFVALENRT
jgi:hypothetical protein